MDIFIRASAGILIALICYLILSKYGRDISTLLTITVCTIIAIAAFQYIDPIIDLIRSLEHLGNIDSQMVQILLRSVGIGFLAEITSLVCIDSGNAAMGKTLQLLGGIVILWLSIPLFREMIELIKTGAENIACLQPFACLPNHVTGKGMMKALREQYPYANIVAIDYDPGASDVNQLNRIKLMMATAHKNLALKEKQNA